MSVTKTVRFIAAGSTVLTIALGAITKSIPLSTVATPPSLLNRYSDTRRHAPRYTLPYTYDGANAQTGSLTFNTTTGHVEGKVCDAPRPSVWAKVVTITQESQIQPAIDAECGSGAQDGDVLIRIPSNVGGFGYDYFISRRRRSAGWLVIEDNRVEAGTFPVPAGRMVARADAAAMPRFNVAADRPVFWIGLGCSSVQIRGLNLTMAGNYNPGDARNRDVRAGTYGFVRSCLNTSAGDLGARGPQTGVPGDLADLPYRIVIDRCAVHGAGIGRACIRGIQVEGAQITKTGNCVWDVGSMLVDSSALTFTFGSGPYYIAGNDLAAAVGETMFTGGGASCRTLANVPKDIQIVGNVLRYDQKWRRYGLPTKNLWETKSGIRILVEGNVFVGYVGGTVNGLEPPGGGQGFVMIPKSHAQDATQGDYDPNEPDLAYQLTQDVTIRANVFRECAAGPAFVNNSQGANEAQPSRIEFAHNLFLGPTTAPTDPLKQPWFLALGGATYNVSKRAVSGQDVMTGADPFGDETRRTRDVWIHHNTFVLPSLGVAGAWLMMLTDSPDGAPLTRLQVEGNVFVQDVSHAVNSYVCFASVGDIGSARSATPPTTARTNWSAYANEGKNVGSTWRGNVVTEVTNLSALIAGDVTCSNLALKLDRLTGVFAAGSPALASDIDGGAAGADTGVIAAALALAI